MSPSTTALVVAVISAIVSLSSAAGLELSRRRSSREIEKVRNDSQRALEALKDELIRKREAETKVQEAQQLVAKYRDPLLRSAFDLQSRIYNIVRPGGFSGGRDPDYFRLNTLFVIAEFLGWLEIVRCETNTISIAANNALSVN